MNKEEAERNRTRALFEVARNMSTAQNIDELLGEILEKSRDVMDCEVCSIFLPEGPEESLTIRSTQQESHSEPVLIPKGKGIAGEVFSAKQTVNTEDAASDDRHFLPPDDSSSLIPKAMLTVPLLEGERCLGVMQAINPNSESQFGRQDEEIFETFASFVSVTLMRLEAQKSAIREAEIRQELTLANEIQDSFLPETEVYHGDLHVKTFYEPASEIGGDFYFWHRLGGNQIILGIGDVCGKGLPAALDMARGTTLIASLAHRAANQSLGEWVSEVNTRLCEVMSAGRFIAATALLFDPDNDTVHVCEAGLPMPKIFDGTSWINLRTAGNPPLGISDRIEYHAGEVALSQARNWLIFSDGVLEVQNSEGEHFEDRAFGEALKDLEESGNGEVLKNLKEAWQKFAAGASYQDDTTVMTVTNLAVPPRGEFHFNCSPQTTRQARDFVESWASYCRLNEEAKGLVILGCDEVFSNLIKHAHGSGQKAPTLMRAERQDDALRITIEHHGKGISNEEFDQLVQPPSCADRIGGLGNFVIKEVFDSVNFQKSDESCSVTLVKKARN
ncbi:MAG: SpoIIE family protein phosphatase [Verrucomicrobiota bacterium]